ncbi:MAG: 30S ribosomal protein S4 [Proteobacteria bacterium]|nr:30S ribosomal protein S4 [Pseudomonadota bacterium]
MARYAGPVCRFCRREGLKLFLKAERCYTDKCSFERNQYPPGQHGQNRRLRVSDYGLQLREKQKVKRIYGLLEKSFRSYYVEAARRKGNTGELLLALLENRFDNTIFRMGFAGSRSEARQLLNHGHFLVNGRKLDISSYQMCIGDVVTVREASQKMTRIIEAAERAINRPQMSWLEVDTDKFTGKVLTFPVRAELTLPITENLIVELYSR